MRYCNEASFSQQGTIWSNDLSVLLQSNSLTQSIDKAPEVTLGLYLCQSFNFLRTILCHPSRILPLDDPSSAVQFPDKPGPYVICVLILLQFFIAESHGIYSIQMGAIQLKCFMPMDEGFVIALQAPADVSGMHIQRCLIGEMLNASGNHLQSFIVLLREFMGSSTQQPQ